MTCSIRTSCLLLALAAAAPATAEERVVTIDNAGQPIVGTLSRPDGDPAPAVLLLHGFTGARDELPIPSADGEGVFARTARLLDEAGYASLRIDFRGSGDSTADLAFADTTFEGQVADAMAALRFLQGSDAVRGDDLYLIGWSQGGLVGTAVAGRSDAFDAVALWAAPADPMAAFGGLVGAETMAAGLAAGPDEATPVTLPWGAEIELKGGFFDGVETFDPEAEIAAYPGPLLVAQGTLDTTVEPANADALLAAHDGPEDRFSAEMDHVFNALETTDTLDAMIAATIRFFDEHADG